MTAMTDLVPSYKREVAPLGQFATLFPTVTDDDIASYLGDSFAAGQIQGFFSEYALDVDGGEVTPDLSPGLSQLVVMLAGLQHLRTAIASTDTRNVYEAASVKVERERAASVLAELLRSGEDRLNRLIKDLVTSNQLSTSVYTLDVYADRVTAGILR